MPKRQDTWSTKLRNYFSSGRIRLSGQVVRWRVARKGVEIRKLERMFGEIGVVKVTPS